MITIRRAFLALLCCTLAALLASAITFADSTPTSTNVSSTSTAEAVPNTNQIDLINQQRKEKQLRQKLTHRLKHLHKATWRWQDSALKRRTPAGRVHKIKSTDKLKHLVKKWRKLRARSRYIALHPPNKWAWACIHRHEAGPEVGGWRANTGNKYYGGLQMDLSFQRTYGGMLLARKGTANNWTWYEQMHVAERARRSGRGFYPWPRTARACGLI